NSREASSNAATPNARREKVNGCRAEARNSRPMTGSTITKRMGGQVIFPPRSLCHRAMAAGSRRRLPGIIHRHVVNVPVNCFEFLQGQLARVAIGVADLDRAR